MITFYNRSGNPIPYDPEHTIVGYLPAFFDENDPRPAREQIDERYAHGGGWHPLKDWASVTKKSIRYKGDPPYTTLATAKLRNEELVFYEHEWLAIFQPDGTYEIARVN